jgi:hypothetical protein
LYHLASHFSSRKTIFLLKRKSLISHCFASKSFFRIILLHIFHSKSIFRFPLLVSQHFAFVSLQNFNDVLLCETSKNFPFFASKRNHFCFNFACFALRPKWAAQLPIQYFLVRLFSLSSLCFPKICHWTCFMSFMIIHTLFDIAQRCPVNFFLQKTMELLQITYALNFWRKCITYFKCFFIRVHAKNFAELAAIQNYLQK